MSLKQGNTDISSILIGGSGGTSDYTDLTNKPKINNVTLSGNKTSADLSLANASHTHTSSEITDLDIPTSLSDLSDDATHRVVTDTEKSTWNAKQDIISDLATIRSGASAGATALQSESDPVFSASASAGITSSDITTWNNKSDFSGDYDDLSNKPTIPVNSDFTLNGLSEKSYNNLTDKPTIPTDTSDLTNGAGFIDNTYHDSSKQDYLVSGTNIKTINNTSILGSGNIEIQSGTSYTAGDGITINDNEISAKVGTGIFFNSNDEISLNANTQNILAQVSTKQDALVSGTNIKTINSQSLLGSGDITISSGSSDYSDLTNKPQINSVTLSGNKSLSDLGINNFSGDYNDLSNKPTIPTNLSDLTDDLGSNPTHTHSQYLTSILDAYPVGSIYMSVNSANPGTLFGGTWEQIKDTFLLSAGDNYTAGLTGGEATHQLTVNEIPSHNHGMYNRNIYATGGSNAGATIHWKPAGAENNTTQNTGGGQAHNNMPPYLTVYMWKRTA